MVGKEVKRGLGEVGMINPQVQSPAWMSGLQGYLTIRNRTTVGPYRRPMPRVLCWSEGGGRFLMGEVPLHMNTLGRASLGVCVLTCTVGS